MRPRYLAKIRACENTKNINVKIVYKLEERRRGESEKRVNRRSGNGSCGVPIWGGGFQRKVGVGG